MITFCCRLKDLLEEITSLHHISNSSSAALLIFELPATKVNEPRQIDLILSNKNTLSWYQCWNPQLSKKLRELRGCRQISLLILSLLLTLFINIDIIYIDIIFWRWEIQVNPLKFIHYKKRNLAATYKHLSHLNGIKKI